MKYFFKFELHLVNVCFQFIIFCLFFDYLLFLNTHMVFTSNIGLNSLDLLQYSLPVIRVIAVELIIVGLNPLLQSFDHLLTYHSLIFLAMKSLRLELAIRSLHLSLCYIFNELVQLIDFVNLLTESLHLKFEEIVIVRTLEAAVCEVALFFSMKSIN